MDTAQRRASRSARIGTILAVIPLAALGILGVGAAASAAPPGKITFCHATGSETNPFVRITTSISAWEAAHSWHQGDEDFTGDNCDYEDPYGY